MRALHAFLTFTLLTAVAVAQELPVSDGSSRLEFEPDLQLTGPGVREEPANASGGVPKLETDLERAKKTLKSFESLFKAGAVAKVEVERRGLKVIVLTRDLAYARLAAARADLEAARAAKNPADLPALESAVREAEALAQQEKAACQKAQLDAAKLNLQRWQKLLAWGGARRSDVTRAEEQLAALQREP